MFELPGLASAPFVEVRQVFDEERALAEIREQLERRDDAQGEKQNATSRMGQIFLDARKAMPGVKWRNGSETYSRAFLTFVEKTGLSKFTATMYMTFARSPEKYQRCKARTAARDRGRVPRNSVLREIRDALLESTREEVLLAINTELANETPFVS